MSGLTLGLRQVRLEHRAFWRNPAAAFFTVVFPLVFMVIADLALAVPLGGADVAARFYTPAIITFGVVTACYTNVAMGVVLARENGILKRLRGTPLPMWAYLAGRVGQAVLVAAALAILVGAFGAIAYGVALPLDRLPQVAAALVVGAAAFSALGLAVTRLVPDAASAPAVVNATILPLLLVSDVLVPLDEGPLATLASLFPVSHLANAFAAAYDPSVAAAGIYLASLSVVAGWGVAAVVAAWLTFRWEPRA